MFLGVFTFLYVNPTVFAVKTGIFSTSFRNYAYFYGFILIGTKGKF